MKEKHCEKCKYYIQHYALLDVTGLSTVNFGHCRLNVKSVRPEYFCNNYIRQENGTVRSKNITCLTYLGKIDKKLKSIKDSMSKIKSLNFHQNDK